MRRDEINPDKNHEDYMNNAEAVAGLLSLSQSEVAHTVWLYYEVMLHKLCNTVLDTNHKVNEVELELPFIGVLTLCITNGEIMGHKFKPEDDFISDLNKAVEKGESDLINLAKKSVGKKISQRYRELL